MPLINETANEPIAASGAWSAVGVVRRRGLTWGAGGRRWCIEQRTPVAFVLEGPTGSQRHDVPQQAFNPLPAIAPVIAYLIVRTLIRRRSRR